MNHPKKIVGYEWNMENLWEDIGNLDYDALTELFGILSKKFAKDSLHDKELNHPQVAIYLGNIAKGLQEILEKDIQPLADLCREYNKKGIK